MQRRRISADIVNPSTSERSLDTISRDDSLFSSQIAGLFKPSVTSIGLERTLFKQDLLSSTSGRNGGHDIVPTYEPLPQHVHLASIDLGSEGMPAHLNHPGLTSLRSFQTGKDGRGSFDNHVHGGRFSVSMRASPTSSSVHSVSSFNSGSFRSRTTFAQSADSSLLTAPSSCEPIAVEIAPTTSPTRLAALHSRPILSKESVRQYTHVDSLVDTATIITHALWPYSESSATRQVELDSNILGHFITETLRKSKTSWSTMQLALLYCIRFRRDQLALARALIEKAIASGHSVETVRSCLGSMCARRNFLSALILASKYLQDRNFSNKAWSKISAVPIHDINAREREFLDICQWKLDIKHDVFKHWSGTMENFIIEIRDGTIFGELEACQAKWRMVIRSMVGLSDPDLSDVMAQLANCNATVVSADGSNSLLTPGLESDASFAPMTASVDKTHVAGPTPPISPCQMENDNQNSHLCPFFDEFIQTSPRQGQEGDAETRPTALEAAYDTPRSLSFTSPESSLAGQTCFGVNDSSELQNPMYALDPMLGAATVVDSQQLLLTPPQSISSDSDMYISCDDICTNSMAGRKRGIPQTRCDNDDQYTPGTGVFVKRRRID